MRSFIVPFVIVTVLAGFSLTGCEKKPAPAPAPKGTGPAAQPKVPPVPGDGTAQFVEKKPRPGGIAGTIERPKRENDLRQLATFYQTYVAERGRSPAKVEDFLNYIKRDGAGLVHAIHEGYYQVVVNAPRSGNPVVAYERDPDPQGHHLVARSDASIDALTSEALQAALAGK